MTNATTFHSEQGHDSDVQLWTRMTSCCTVIENELRTRLRNEFGTTLPHFEMMAQLAGAPEGLKMSELSRRMRVTNGNITGITDQLEKEGLVERSKLATDRRTSVIKLTINGRQAFSRMSKAHEQWLHDIFSRSPQQKRSSLYKNLGVIKSMLKAQLHNKPA